MRWFPAVVLAVLLVCGLGCPGAAPVVPTVSEPAVKEVQTSPVSAETAVIGSKLSPEHKEQLKAFAKKLALHDARVEKWSKRSLWWGISVAVLGFLLILPTIVGWFGKTVPLLTGAVGFTSMALSWMASKVSARAGKAAGSALPRWGLWILAAGGMAIGASYCMDAIFMFVKWSMWGAGVLIGLSLAWEGACFYYTGKLDVPGDGVKPSKG